MTVSQRLWFIRVSIIIGILLAALLFIAVIQNRGEKNPNSTLTNTTTENLVNPTPSVLPGSLPPSRAATSTMSPSDRYLVQLSRVVVERLGSYSNQNDNNHIDDIMPLLTDRMVRYVNTLRVNQSNTYSGQTTRVVTAALQSKSGAKATILVSVQIENVTATNSERLYKNARVELSEVKKDDWRVDGIFWE